MKLAKSLLLGSATAFVAVAGANAADLPSKKAAPVTYVKVCDAYGAGFFNIPGTETCIKVGGRVRADYAYSQAKDIYSALTSANVSTVSAAASGMNTWGTEVRGRVDLDARTPTAYGTVQAVTSLRMAKNDGVLTQSSNPNKALAGASGTLTSLFSSAASSTLEAAYIRFAGFTFGNAKDNFSFMPSIYYASGHWASFSNGVNTIAYTAVLGGGVSATLALQDATYSQAAIDTVSFTNSTSLYSSFTGMPQINGRLDWDQSWGTLSLVAATNQLRVIDNTTATAPTKYNKQVWAIGGGVKINLPMLAAGDALWLNSAYANGMTEYTINFSSYKSSAYARDAAGFQFNPPSASVYSATGIETVKSWNLAAIFQHFVTPQHRLTFMASGGGWKAPTSATAAAWNGKQYYGDGNVWQGAAQYAFVPTKDFEIGIETLYNRTSQKVNNASVVSSTKSDGNWSGRLRIERTF